MLWLITSVALGATVEINPGDDWCTAINAADAGDEIVLLAGDHDGPCAIRTAGVTLRGDGTQPHIVYGGAGSNVIDVEADSVTISDVWIGPTQPNIDAIKIKSGNDTHISGCLFDQVGGITISANTTDSSGIQIVDNRFDDLQATGIYLGCHEGDCRAADFLIADNLIDGVVSSGIGYGMETKVNSWGLIRDNVVNNTQGPAIEVYGSEDVTEVTVVEGNYVVGSTNDGTLEIGGGPAVVRNNIVVGGTGGGIYAYDYGGRGLQREVQILGNSVIGTAGQAIRVSAWVADRGLVIANNAAWQQSGYGPALPSPAPGIDMTSNIECDDACWLDTANGDYTPANLGTGTSGYDMAADFCGETRADPPLQGAIDGTGPGALTIDFKATFSCPEDNATDTDNPTTGDDDDDDDGGPAAADGAGEEGGCGCVGGGGSASWLLALIAALSCFMAIRTRQS